MKNADMPAIPIQECGPDGLPQGPACYGLTKREMFAMAAMQGLYAHSGDYHEFSHLASDAVNYADYVLAELEKTSCQQNKKS